MAQAGCLCYQKKKEVINIHIIIQSLFTVYLPTKQEQNQMRCSTRADFRKQLVIRVRTFAQPATRLRFTFVSVLLYVPRGSQDGQLDSHTAPEL